LTAVSISPAFTSALPDAFIFTLPDGTDLVVRRRADMPRRRSVGGVAVDTWVGAVDGLSPLASVVTLQVLPGGQLHGTLHYLDRATKSNRNFLVNRAAVCACVCALFSRVRPA
jgi:hypothetical protein